MGITTKTGLNENGQSSSVFEGRAIGDIIPHMGTTAPPGTLVCDGSEVSREAYAELYQEIGSLVGQGDGSTTFNLPDLRGRWMMGADAERVAGEEVAEGLPNITGAITEIADQALCGGATGAFQITAYYNTYKPSGDIRNAPVKFNFSANRSSPIYGAQSHVTPASVAVLPCIVYE